MSICEGIKLLFEGEENGIKKNHTGMFENCGRFFFILEENSLHIFSEKSHSNSKLNSGTHP
jgi:hypothetical protein